MVTQEILKYLREQKARGVSEEMIRAQMRSVEWKDRDIDEAFMYLKNESVVSVGKNAAKNLTKLKGPIELLKESWQLYKMRYWTFLGLMGISVLVILASVLLFVLIVVTLGALSATLLKGNSFVTMLLGIALFLVAIFFIISVSVRLQISMLIAVTKAEEGIRLREALKQSKGKVIAFYWISFLTSLITMGGYFLAIIPGIIFSVWFIFVNFIFIVEGQKGMQAFLRSREYVRNYWKPVLWRIVFISLVGSVFSLISFLLGYFEEHTGGVFVSTMNWVVILASVVLAPLFAIYQYLLYKNLKAIKGDLTVNQSDKKKYILVGIGGFIIFVCTIGFLIWFLLVPVFKNPEVLNTFLDQYQQDVSGERQRKMDSFMESDFNIQDDDTNNNFTFPTGTPLEN